jgi:hypothetical protein
MAAAAIIMAAVLAMVCALVVFSGFGLYHIFHCLL